MQANQIDDALFGPWAAEAALQLMHLGSELAEGEQIGPYVIEVKLGVGGMGEVYRALDARLKRRVALKVVDSVMSGDPEWQRRFFAEAQTIANLNHPNICALYDVGEHEGMPYIVMELIEGETLRSRLERGPMREAEALPYATALASALEYAHGRGVVHRDIKPGNLILTSTNSVKLVDFGIAWDKTEARDAIQAGTHRYAAPEQLADEPDARSDLYSFGVVFFEALTGRLPNGDNVPSSPSRGLMRTMARCLAPEPGARWQTAGELREALEKHAEQGRHSIFRSVAVAAVLVALLAAVAYRFGPWSVPERIDSVAILPLDDPSGAETYFADQVTEDLTRSLSNARGLRVLSFSSTAPYRGDRYRPGEMARRMGVEAIVRGAVHRSADRLSISLSIVDARDESVIAKVDASRSLTQTAALSNEVARSVASRLHAEMPEPAAGIASSRPVNPAAWAEYARGRQLCAAVFSGRVENMAPNEASAKAMLALDTAAALDGEFAPVHAARAQCLWYRMYIGLDPPDRLAPQVRGAALRAIRLDRTLGEPHAIAGAIRRDHDWDWEGAETHFRRAVELEPGNVQARGQYALYLTAMGRFEEAVRQAQRGTELDPASVELRLHLTMAEVTAGNREAAARHFEALLRDFPSAGPPYALATWFYRRVGRTKESAVLYTKARDFYPIGSDHVMDVWLMPELIAQEGHAAGAKLIASWEAQSKRRYVDPYNLASMHMASGDSQRALQYLKKAVADRSPSVFMMNSEPWFEDLRNRPAYRDLVRSVNLE